MVLIFNKFDNKEKFDVHTNQTRPDTVVFKAFGALYDIQKLAARR